MAEPTKKGKVIWANVYVEGPDGNARFFEAGEEVPEEYASRINSPVWDKPDEEAVGDETAGVSITENKAHKKN